mmetsp:Transcript_69027/g.122935  ORF Transcript_69027/g.122935 Transcript_69027/m.122935 type:complete len:160 (-) Transcript_69027:804-1283(-)
MSCAWLPFSRITPSAQTKITSQSEIVDRRCAMAKEVRPTLAASKACCTTFSLAVSKALVASSNSNTGGSRARALQIATRCFCPPESLLPRGPTEVFHPCPLAESMKLRLDIFLHVSSHSSDTVSPSSKPYVTLARTVVLNRIGSCPTKPICFLHHLMLT